MSNNKKTDAQDVAEKNMPAGRFSSWLRRTLSTLAKNNGTDVPCGECIACCRSSYFIHVGPGETKVISRINSINDKLLFPAIGLPEGNLILGHYKNGYCPMMIDGKCSIYENRPITCRNYDCRIFAATGIPVGNKSLIAECVKHWSFSFSSKIDRDQHAAVQAAAAFLQEYGDCFPDGFVPSNPTQLAVLAIKVYEVFLDHYDDSCKRSHATNVKIAKKIMKVSEKFGALNTTK